MRKKLLLSSAALLAGIALASAQNMPSGGQNQPGSASHDRAQSPQDRSAQSPQGSQGQPNQSQSQRGEQNQRDQKTGQAPQGQREQSRENQREQGQSPTESRREQSQGQAPRTGEQGQAQQEQGREGQSKQGQPQQGQAHGQGQIQQGQAREGQSQQRQPQQGPAAEGQTQQGQVREQGQGPQGQTQQGQAQKGQSQQQGQAQVGGSAALSSEQQTRIREAVFTDSNVPRVDNVNFSVRVGTIVPTTVRVVEVPETLIAIHPEWRGHEYFVVRDDIVIVDHSHRIVTVVPTGSSNAQSSSSPSFSEASGSLNLSQEEIRQLQIALNEKGFNIGEPDGALGPRTKNALIQFQQREGFQATGQIDQRTVAALGLSIRGQPSMQGQPSSGTGQAGERMQQPSAGQQGSAGGRPPSTAGQAGETTQQPSVNQGAETGAGITGGQPASRTPQNANPSSNRGAPQAR